MESTHIRVRREDYNRFRLVKNFLQLRSQENINNAELFSFMLDKLYSEYDQQISKISENAQTS